MRALTVHEPWATAIALGAKAVENRNWPPPPALFAGERFAVHAGRESAIHRDDVYWVALQMGLDGDRLLAQVRPGHLLCTVELERAVGTRSALPAEQQRWFSGRYGWVLRDVRRLSTPVPCRGMQGLWTVPADVERLVLEAGGWP